MRDSGQSAVVETKDTGCGESLADESVEFENEIEDDFRFVDNIETDPDWAPTEDDEEEDEEASSVWEDMKTEIQDPVTIANVWTRKQKENLDSCLGKTVSVGGDARCCTPGHNAKYGSYTLMDLDTGLVLATELVQSNEVKNSNAMELEGFKRAMTRVENHGVSVSDITTDHHVQVRKVICEEKENIRHWFDVWHVAKKIKTKLTALGKKKGCEVITKWNQSIANHLYFSAAMGKGDGDLIEEIWLSVLNHVTNQHDGHGDRFPCCLHETVEREWIKRGSKAHKELVLLLGNKRLLTDIRKLSPIHQTSELESHHNMVCQFAPKFVHFSYAVMKQRINLASLRTCCNAGRAQAKTKEGILRYGLSYPKYKAGKHIVKPIMNSCSYDYVNQLMNELLHLKGKYNSHEKAQQAAEYLYTAPPPLTDSVVRVNKVSTVGNHRTRFV